jgi:hypothetical protein
MDRESKKYFATPGKATSYDPGQSIGPTGNPPDRGCKRSRPPRSKFHRNKLATVIKQPQEHETTETSKCGYPMGFKSLDRSSKPYLTVRQPDEHPALVNTEVGMPSRESAFTVTPDQRIHTCCCVLDSTIHAFGWNTCHANLAQRFTSIEDYIPDGELVLACPLTNVRYSVRNIPSNQRNPQGTSTLDTTDIVHKPTSNIVSFPSGIIHINNMGEVLIPVNIMLRLHKAIRAAPSITTEVICRVNASYIWLALQPRKEFEAIIRRHLQNWFRKRCYNYVSVMGILPILDGCSPLQRHAIIAIQRPETLSRPLPPNTLTDFVDEEHGDSILSV